MIKKIRIMRIQSEAEFRIMSSEKNYCDGKSGIQFRSQLCVINSEFKPGIQIYSQNSFKKNWK